MLGGVFSKNIWEGASERRNENIIVSGTLKIYGHSIIWPKAYSEKLIIPFKNVFKAYFKNIFIIL